ncbi:MAG: hypothetical protein LH606_19995 [Cytophagaceae bacterium]|nr:hypothetical protein [Cytophagaceae bacterium]
MIETPQLPAIPEHELPQFKLHQEIVSPYRIVEQFVGYTIARIEEEKWPVVSTRLQLADQLWQSGTRVVRNAIEAVYVPSSACFSTRTGSRTPPLVARLASPDVVTGN